MRPSAALKKYRAKIKAVIKEHKAANARVFGSVLNGTDTETSDLDILIDPGQDMTLFDIGAIRHKLKQLTGVEVDILTPGSLSDTIRDEVLLQAKPI
ncbi:MULTISPECIES: nucleotidyltransferase family protein [Gammaproteobacteria]|uniref:nucleotidyltransferase family protein n=1 Tax=Gammaproteobacteria TaxID=1236 RepID=UPI001ADB02BE|nr:MULTISPECIES: nucleotidyltransferase family protein [Gammaproteobacteria]MBO9483079.1 nucleotidyltransferase family protein [Salinisphaera sp. G21_0]MBO9497429.1 nucleotidyltransferase family protein [Thalassotalea sp. G20_0]